MNPLVLGPIIKIAEEIFDRIIPDREGRAKAKLEMERMLIERRSEIIAATQASDAGQVEVNKVEASQTDLFRGGWRPAVGWSCAIGVFYQFVARPLLTWLSPDIGLTTPPSLEMTDLLFLLGGMLGLGTLRTVEKKAGVS